MKKTYRHAIIIIIIIGLGLWGLWNIIPGPTSGQTTDVQASLSPNSVAQVGTDIFTLTLTDASGQPIDGATVNVDINMTTMNMGKQTSQASAQGKGVYAITGQLLMRGPWKISTTITLPSGEITAKEFVVTAR